MTFPTDKVIFDAYRNLIGPFGNDEFRLIKRAIDELDKSGEDHELFRVLGLIDDDDRISHYEFETLKSAIVAYQDKDDYAEPKDYVDPDREVFGSSVRSMMTVKVVQELVHHEALVLEAYRDSKGIWTWAIGIATTSGQPVRKYKDNPQSIETAVKASVDLMIDKYAPAVLRAFRDHKLSENEFASALSFHYNTGAIEYAQWVKSFLRGQPTKARSEFMNWRKPAEIIDRRKAERDLFFDNEWTNDGKTTIYPVRKPKYSPHWSKARRVDIRDEIRAALS